MSAAQAGPPGARPAARPAALRTAGFTLLELLMVMAIIAIIAGAFFWNLSRTIRRNEVQDAAYQLIGDLRQARSAAQKTGQKTTVTILPNTGSYTVQTAGQSVLTRTLPHDLTVNTVNTIKAAPYQPPYGTLDATGPSWVIQSPVDAGLNVYVNVVGVTGKVMLSATRR